jgi:hypothetical protein
MNLSRLLVTGLAAVAGALAMLALDSSAQPPAEVPAKVRVVEVGPDGTRVERTVEERLINVTQPANSPWVAGGRTHYGYGFPGGAVLDAESQKLLNQERGAAQEARALASNAQLGNSEAEKADAKKKLREKLVEIFDLQQERRNREIAKIEERLGKLKETLKKRDAAKDSIIDRRLETLTGGVDELGWEDSLADPRPKIPTINPLDNPSAQLPDESHYPAPVPAPPSRSRFGPPSPEPGVAPAFAAPPGVAPAFAVPPGVPALPAAAPPPPAPAPAAAPVPVPPARPNR